MLSKERVPEAKNAIVKFRSRPFVELTASRQVITEIDRKEGGSALEPLPDLDFGKKDSLISLFQNDLIKSEGLKTEI